MSERYLYLKTIGSVKAPILERLCGSLNSILACKVMSDNEYPVFAFEPKRNQYYARMIIEKLVCTLPSDCEKLIGITDVDLCTPVLTFVYGEAQLGGRVALVSLNRLKQEFYHLPTDDKLLAERLLKVCTHELGHCYGLFHCSDPGCVMYLSNNIMSIDNKRSYFCVKCDEFFGSRNRKEKRGQA